MAGARNSVPTAAVTIKSQTPRRKGKHGRGVETSAQNSKANIGYLSSEGSQKVPNIEVRSLDSNQSLGRNQRNLNRTSGSSKAAQMTFFNKASSIGS